MRTPLEEITSLTRSEIHRISTHVSQYGDGETLRGKSGQKCVGVKLGVGLRVATQRVVPHILWSQLYDSATWFFDILFEYRHTT